MTKQIIEHPMLYIAAFIRDIDLPYIIFVHGGPGLNSGVLEHLIVHEGIFDNLKFNIVLYDQRGCGRSKKINNSVLHADNLADLEEVYKILSVRFNIAAIAGHSYGAKLLFDYLKTCQIKISGIFIATASSMLTPRINNLLLDFAYLKSVDSVAYQEILDEFDNYSSDVLWRITEKLANVFQENKTRPYFYWANLKWQEKVMQIQDVISLPLAMEVFKSVRQDLYTHSENFSVDIESTIKSPYLWINGFHDLIMNGALVLTQDEPSIKLFFKSAHYPHIEEHEKFCEEVNAFLNDNRL